ncbi:hypothetical protein M413DRAFT_79626 [Hebeloma cylindrosporum]|uniref:Uncharacterized protein n=1 Tax=Hebeloma cylindrosporum TaxID=76867 RepID=A0A0C3BEL8_HEBCY|nr:hypothetical protein M413DRAFT_79626 [Hebeloma cylindrosporum h7]
MWDDTTDHWGKDSFLNIQGHPIAIVYWKAVYTSKQGTGWMPGQWKLLKGNVFNWKVLVKRWRKGTPDQFWEEFSEGGKPLGYKSILSRLAVQRKARNDMWAQKARDEFGSSFDNTFSYVKNGQRHVKTKAGDIAKQYCLLKNICDDDDDDDDKAEEEEEAP